MYEQLLQIITTLRHTLHQHPELSMQESGTKARLMAFLRAHTALELHDMGRWFYAVYRAAAPPDTPARSIKQTRGTAIFPPYAFIP